MLGARPQCLSHHPKRMRESFPEGQLVNCQFHLFRNVKFAYFQTQTRYNDSLIGRSHLSPHLFPTSMSRQQHPLNLISLGRPGLVYSPVKTTPMKVRTPVTCFARGRNADAGLESVSWQRERRHYSGQV